jgi:hypothetical protein
LALFAAAAPSLIQRPYFPYGLPREAVIKIIEGTHKDRPEMLREFGDMFFFRHVTKAFSMTKCACSHWLSNKTKQLETPSLFPLNIAVTDCSMMNAINSTKN